MVDSEWPGQPSKKFLALQSFPQKYDSSISDLQKMAVAEWLQSFNSVRGPMEILGII